MKHTAPPWLAHVAEISDAERYAQMSPEERFLCFMDICVMTEAILSSRADRQRVFEEREPMRPQDEAAWLRLVKESRRAGQAG